MTLVCIVFTLHRGGGSLVWFSTMSLYDDIDIAESVAKDKKAELGEWAKG